MPDCCFWTATEKHHPNCPRRELTGDTNRHDARVLELEDAIWRHRRDVSESDWDPKTVRRCNDELWSVIPDTEAPE